MQASAVKVLILIALGATALGASLVAKTSALYTYILLYVLVFLLFKPKYLISPQTIIHSYYFVFFIIAPLFAGIHREDDFSSFDFHLAFSMIFLTHTTAAFGSHLGHRWTGKKTIAPKVQEMPSHKGLLLETKIAFFYLTSSILVYAIIQSSGGILYWFEAPGDAFLNRAGSGIYVVLSHLSTFILAGLVGFSSYRSGQKSGMIVFLFWLAITSPVHGSKQLIAIFLAISLAPWIRSVKLVSLAAIIFSAALIGVFFFGLYLRNVSWMTLEDALPYALNYFTTLRNLMILLEDFDPGFMQTFFLPFNKFLTPFGLSDPRLYFDMNHMLTDIYFPSAWEIRATEQWPVEADLYLNFYFIFGLPVIFLYTFLLGAVNGRSQSRPNLGICVVSTILVFSIVSHLRGSIYNHVDFYLYPMLFLIYLALRSYPLPFKASTKTT